MQWLNEPVDIKLLGRQLVAVLFLTAFVLQTLNRPFIVASYYANTSSYEANCENIARPELQCHGKCQMMKKLQAEEKKDAQNPERKSENKNELVYAAHTFMASLEAPYTVSLLQELIPGAGSDKLSNRSYDIFHPPQA